jgi:peptidoglycan/xylan/chitin deacetylase (PgdA/CDA1 family)
MKKLNRFVVGILILFCCASAFPQKREVAITFDDLPTTQGDLAQMRFITANLLKKLKAEKVPAIGFVNEGKLYRNGEIKERTAILQMWVDAGFELGNHTYSHISPDQQPIEAYKQDVIGGERVTRRLLQQKKMKLRYFRHPYLRTGKTIEYKTTLDAFLKARGYTIAPVTIDNNDYIFADVYSKAREKGDVETMNRVAAAYIPYMEKVIEFFEQLSRDSFGYEVKQTLLLHANELNADYFDKLAAMMKRRGYSFVTLEEALKDNAYSLPDAQTNRGLSWIHRWRIAKNLELKEEPKEPEFITKLFRQDRQPQQGRNR